MKTKHAEALLGVVLLTAAANAFAADAQEDPWRFSATIPIWALGVDGDVTLRGTTADVGVSFDQLAEKLDAVYSLGVEARKQQYGFFGDFGYMKFSADDSSGRGTSSDAELKILIANAGGFYRLIKTSGDRPFILEAIAGARFWDIETNLKLTSPRGRVLLDGSNSTDLVDPVVGLRGSQFLTQKWHLDFQSDVGGFGISDSSSDLTWSAAGMVAYDVTMWCSLSAGYKALSLDMEEDSGAKKRGADIIMHGLLISAKFTF